APEGRPPARRQDADGRGGDAGHEPRRPIPGHGSPGLHGGGDRGLAAPLRGAAVLRQRARAPPARGAREREPDRQDVAAPRRGRGGGGRAGRPGGGRSGPSRGREAAVTAPSDLEAVLGGGELLATTRTRARGPEGRLPITP